MTSKNIMIVGVGGRGTLLINHILGRLTISADYDVRLSGVHGMVQRGDSVVTFMRYGERAAEPIVEGGRADVLITFERLKALRYLHFLREDSVTIVNNWRTDPVTVVTGVVEYPEGVTDQLKEVRRTTVVEAAEGAKKMGALKTFNVIVLGAAVKYMGFEKEDWLEVIETTVPLKTVEINKKAFETGYTLSVWTDESRR